MIWPMKELHEYTTSNHFRNSENNLKEHECRQKEVGAVGSGIRLTSSRGSVISAEVKHPIVLQTRHIFHQRTSMISGNLHIEFSIENTGIMAFPIIDAWANPVINLAVG